LLHFGSIIDPNWMGFIFLGSQTRNVGLMTTGMFQEAEDNDEGPLITVTLPLRDVQAVTRILSLLIRKKPFSSPSALERQLLREHSVALIQETVREDPVKWKALIQIAQEEYRARRSRSRLFDEAMFGEPAWDMLLALFINGRSGEKLTISRLQRFSGGSASGALRWLNYLEEQGLVERESNPYDARSALILLSERAERAMETYFSETLRLQS
jgi:DNA-binding MarR family transcriptional regulator